MRGFCFLDRRNRGTIEEEEEEDPSYLISAIKEEDKEGRHPLASIVRIKETQDTEGREDHSSLIIFYPPPQLLQLRRWTTKKDASILLLDRRD